jgi:hypothetical protein
MRGPRTSLSGDFVVLLVGVGGFDRDGAALEFLDERGEGLGLGDGVFARFFAEFFSEEIADADADGGIGQEVFGEEVVERDHFRVLTTEDTESTEEEKFGKAWTSFDCSPCSLCPLWLIFKVYSHSMVAGGLLEMS